MQDYCFFWRGYLSNWYKAEFWDRGIKYSCVEQYMMAHKAMLFGDAATHHDIMKQTDPRNMKALGRRVNGYNDMQWDFFKCNIVFRGLLCKFQQWADLRHELLTTGDKILVEASPYDRVWGIGYGEAEAMDNIDKWGENLLGKLLTEVKVLLQ